MIMYIIADNIIKFVNLIVDRVFGGIHILIGLIFLGVVFGILLDKYY